MAGSFGSSGDDEIIAGINITPLVDVVLVLLVIFMMTAPVIYQSAIKIQLPKAKTGETRENNNPLTFSISKEGALVWGQERIDWETLASRLKKLGPSTADQTAIISADEATPHGKVIKLMDALREAGLTHFALNVEAPSPK